MKIYGKNNVLVEARKRISYLFDEFENVIVGFSGGKDSTVVFNLCLEEAKKRGRIPLKVLFLDQEAEWDNVIKYVKSIMTNKDVEPLWIQCPIKIFNATSHKSDWLECWKEGDKWIREKDPLSIKENTFGTDRFAEFFQKFLEKMYPDKKTCYISGVRCEESPTRYVGLTSKATYKHITWGKVLNKKLEHYTLYPLYDWSYTDIWKCIHDHKWRYCKIYDYMFRHGVQPKDMRVSNLHHETAISALYYLQEIEPENWNRLVQRLDGVDTTAKIEKKDNFKVSELPYMFKDWKEYTYFLLDKLVSEENKPKFINHFSYLERKYFAMNNKDVMYKNMITCILANDHYFTKMANFERRPDVNGFRRWKKGKNKYESKYIPGED